LVVLNREEARVMYISALAEIEITKNDFPFMLDLPVSNIDEEGNETYEIHLPGYRKALFSNSCKKKFEDVSKWLLLIKEIGNKYAMDDVLVFTMRRAANYVEASEDIINNSFFEIRDYLKEDIPPLLTVVPVKGILTTRIIQIENVIIGMLSEELEININSVCNEYKVPRFNFTDDVVWTEDYLHWKNIEEDAKEEVDISDLPILLAVWTQQHGYKSTEKIYEYIELFASIISYLQFNEDIFEYAAPDVLSINDYCEMYQQKNVEYGYDSKQFLVHSPVERIKKSEYHQMRGPLINMDILTPTDLDFIGSMFRTLEGKSYAWELRFTRFLHWFHTGNKSGNISNSMVSYSIALESLLNPERVPDSVTNAIAERVAYLDEAASAEERVAVFKNIKKLYDKRSRVTHGQEIMSIEVDLMIIKEMKVLLFDIGQKFLECAKKNDWKLESDMDRYFETKKFS